MKCLSFSLPCLFLIETASIFKTGFSNKFTYVHFQEVYILVEHIFFLGVPKTGFLRGSCFLPVEFIKNYVFIICRIIMHVGHWYREESQCATHWTWISFINHYQVYNWVRKSAVSLVSNTRELYTKGRPFSFLYFFHYSGELRKNYCKITMRKYFETNQKATKFNSLQY